MLARLLLLCSWLLLPCPSSRAQDVSREDIARARFLDGRAAYEQGDYARAFADWQKSYALSQRPELLYNVGLAAQKLGNVRASLDAFEAYLTWGKGEREEEVRGRVAALRDIADQPASIVAPVVPAPAAVAAAAAAPQPGHEHLRALAPPVREEPRRSGRGWWIAAGVVLVAAAIAVGVAVPLSKRDEKPEGAPEPNTGLTIDALRLR